MAKWVNRVTMLLLALSMIFTACASAESQLAFDGTVAADGVVSVSAPIGGTAEGMSLIAGQRIEAGDIVMTLAPEQVTAQESGTVRGIFAKPGDSVDVVAGRYGGVLYVEPDYVYTLSATTENAYNLDENKFVHTGEIVYLTCTDNTYMKGTGVITSVDGSSYTVEVTEGTFGIGDTVNIFRVKERLSKSRIGRGTVARVNPIAYTGSGSISNVLVEEGQHVEAGDVLFETLAGVFDSYYFTGSTVISDVSGIVESVNVQNGQAVSKGDSILNVYPDGSMYIEFNVNEMDLYGISEGDKVEIEFLWNEGEAQRVKGEVTFISLISNQGATDYTARASFTADENIRLGMTAVVYTVSDDSSLTQEEIDEMRDGE